MRDQVTVRSISHKSERYGLCFVCRLCNKKLLSKKQVQNHVQVRHESAGISTETINWDLDSAFS